MPTMDNLFLHNFHEEMAELARRCRANPKRELNDLHAIFHDTDEGLFAYLCGTPFQGYDEVRAALPTWAPDEIRQQSTGAFSFHDHLLDATWFWRTVRGYFERHNGKKAKDAKVVDYGGGWGRVSRFANKDVPARQFYVFEPNPVFRDIYADCKLPGTMVPIDWTSSEATSVRDVDLIFSYSIITHSSDLLTRNIFDRWAEMTKPGAIVAFTMRPGCYLLESDGDMGVFSEAERKGLPAKYSAGDLVYKPYDGIVDWGVTVASEAYLNKVFDGRFKIVHRAYQPQTMNQLITFIQRT